MRCSGQRRPGLHPAVWLTCYHVRSGKAEWSVRPRATCDGDEGWLRAAAGRRARARTCSRQSLRGPARAGSGGRPARPLGIPGAWLLSDRSVSARHRRRRPAAGPADCCAWRAGAPSTGRATAVHAPRATGPSGRREPRHATGARPQTRVSRRRAPGAHRTVGSPGAGACVRHPTAAIGLRRGGPRRHRSPAAQLARMAAGGTGLSTARTRSAEHGARGAGHPSHGSLRGLGPSAPCH
jgi:hypothetical protein